MVLDYIEAIKAHFHMLDMQEIKTTPEQYPPDDMCSVVSGETGRLANLDTRS